MTSKMFFIGTDVAGLFICHPDDLTHTIAWPTGWYDEGPVWQSVSAAGQLVGWGTRSDGGFRARLTTGDLTAEEQTLKGASWQFPYTVRHGRVLYDNSDSWPSHEGPPKPELKDSDWFELANGDYIVTVTGIHWTETGEEPEEAAKRLPHYVVQFAPRGTAPAPALAHRLPDIGWTKGAEVTFRDPPGGPYPPFGAYAPLPADLMAKRRKTAATALPGVTVADIRLRDFRTGGETDLEEAIPPAYRNLSFRERKKGDPDVMSLTVFAAPQMEPGTIGLLCRVNGVSNFPNAGKRFGLAPMGPARLTQVEGRLHNGEVIALKRSWLLGAKPPPLNGFDHPLLSVLVEPLFPSEETLTIDTEALRAALTARLDALSEETEGRSRYYSIRAAAMTDPAWLVRLAMEQLPMPAAKRLQLAALDLQPRAEGLLKWLQSGADR